MCEPEAHISEPVTQAQHRRAATAFVLATTIAAISSPIFAQSAQTATPDTAKPTDTASPYGVSYHAESLTYSVPLFTIEQGSWLNHTTITLDQDNSGAREAYCSLLGFQNNGELVIPGSRDEMTWMTKARCGS